MNKKDLKESFDQMIQALQRVRNVSSEMLQFDGSSEDIERFGYFFYEGLLPYHFSDCLNAGRYIIGVVLEKEHGFNWSGTFLKHPKYDLSIDLRNIVIDESKELYDAADALDATFDQIMSRLARKRIHKSNE